MIGNVGMTGNMGTTIQGDLGMTSIDYMNSLISKQKQGFPLTKKELEDLENFQRRILEASQRGVLKSTF